MTDFAFNWDDARSAADIALNGPDILAENGFGTAVILSLFSDRRASKDDVLPAGSTDRRGWWGDFAAKVEGDQFGSRLWLLERSTITAGTLSRAKDYAEEALAWFVEDGVAQSVEVTVARRDLDQIAMTIVITKPDGDSSIYDFAWKALKNE